MTDATAAVAALPERSADDRWFEEFFAGLEEPPRLEELRRDAWSRYRELPMPSRRSEEWRYTDLADLEPEAFRPAEPAGGAPTGTLPDAVAEVLERSGERAGLFVQRDGAVVHRSLDPELEAAGARLLSIADAVRLHPDLLERTLFADAPAAAEEKLWTLHVALLTGGYFLYLPRDVRVERPIHSFRLIESGGILVATHSLIVADAGAEVTCIDEYLSPDLEEPALSLAGVEVVGGENSRVAYVALQRYGRGVRHFAIQHATAQRDARLTGFHVALGADLARSDITSRLAGPGSESEMLALWFGDGDQHIDHHTLQHHAAANAHSDLLYKGALTDAARSVFRGLIRVDPGAQLTDAYQTNRNLLLSKDSNATTLPNLEILADDVRCSHGATIGQVEEGQLFYLMSRGLTRAQAERVLVFGFFDEVLARLPIEGVRERVRQAIVEKIEV